MRTARLIGSWLTGLIALTLAVALFTWWVRYVLDAPAAGIPAPLLLWSAFGVNLLVWSAVGLVRLADDTVRAARRRAEARAAAAVRRARAETVDLVEAPVDRVLVPPRVGGDAAGGAEAAPAVAPPGTAAARLRPRTVGAGSGDAGAFRIAVVIPAHNEEPVIGAAITSALRLFDRWDVYVVSDSSNDATAEIAARTGVNVLELLSNRGKAGAIETVIQEFDLVGRYDAVVILDADTELDPGYVAGVRRQFADPGVAAVAGFVVAEWKPRERTVVGRLIAAYRDRLYWMLQYLVRYGQTWRRTSVTFIVPGFASAYRTSALRHIDVNPPGLVIEDFNMTFEVHHKRLGRISMSPDTRALCQDPFTLGDYARQVRRWTLGFWQTVRRHGAWPSLFWVALFGYIVEIVLVAALLLVVAALGLFLLLPPLTGGAVLAVAAYADGYAAVGAVLPLATIAVGVFVPDYALTCLMALIRRRPGYLVYGLFFLPMRLVDAYLTLRTIPQAWTAASDGRWRSPERSGRPL
ncbi:glycosyltransferase family 2 protein [Marinitenerispora sediminis]|uniref:Glycosyl transferase n=1 Tax=Marinitenerispora sediminis TaxID=1931232 RepID=A0A368T0Z1_9ACTN|nr:glycosyltransferase [Marinitenerispora sediminis]RCV50773.1 glycosyl transferase [Marinitenerispora sediminis]RCV52673.1 glycosyl transferase [Marinitenerispora sediminis]RCV53616.1 glycosyl transferase [Marinitenerispora sediminis]